MSNPGSMSKKANYLGLRAFAGAIILAFNGLCTANAQTPRLLLTTESYPPLNFLAEDGTTIRGIVPDKVREIMHRTHTTYQMDLMAWNRALELARTRSDTCVFSAARTPEREALFKWVGPLSSGEWVLLGTPDKQGKLNNLEQAKDASIGSYLGDAAGRYLSDKGYNVVFSYNDDITLKNLLAGRLDYWVANKRGAIKRIAESNATGRIVPLLSFRTVQFYLACNVGVDDALISSMRAALNGMTSDGFNERIDAKY